MALPAVFGLPVLPPELLLRVLRLLDVSSLLALSSVNRHLHQTTTDPALWRHLYPQRLPRRPGPEQSQRHSVERALQEEVQVEERSSQLPPPHAPLPPCPPTALPPPPLPNNPFPFYPPGIIGGEYDQRPGIPGGILPRPATTLLVRSQVTIPQQEG
ncbi:F-box only protein 7-like [Oncorhynchus masou masou]|uniref:F-box only protein 7-like n=1 Tax=Oncorhynchus masou masou TaxID=90313 RepID=UPI0031842B9F